MKNSTSIKRLICILFVLFTFTEIWVSNVTVKAAKKNLEVDHIEYYITAKATEKKDGNVSVISNTNATGKIVIPSTVTYEGKKYKVTSIDGYAFMDSKIKSISLPSTITSIGRYAFHGCKSLKELNIPDNTNELGIELASESSIETVTVGKNVKTIPEYAFAKCTKLNKVELPDQMTVIQACAFSYCKKLESIELPSSLTQMGVGAFYSTGLKSITLPSTLHSMEESVFEKCKNLTSIEIPSSINYFYDHAFYNCTNLQHVKLPNKFTNINFKNIFGACPLVSFEIDQYSFIEEVLHKKGYPYTYSDQPFLQVEKIEAIDSQEQYQVTNTTDRSLYFYFDIYYYDEEGKVIGNVTTTGASMKPGDVCNVRLNGKSIECSSCKMIAKGAFRI